ncbi:hypothetical protein ACFO25_08935 [Paenactinomyces guangxiensis]|uniref:SseB protein N-terminal domain-containing protein n=1 Tax=Paenactinomyces guangxiensis TaxID=1490290 RepID=A0A7W2A766_9BACL|nr:hypothetical protein [Paenactinomyces guangxiensis]MBA4492829.1 hypothetical protein [Paenactinomyces guangxiensis]MBH8590322.1 hypothetical protein [Paenactinomyces guangxiensis]
MNVRECLELASSGSMKTEQLYEFFASRVSRLVVLYQKDDSGSKPFLAKGNTPDSKFVAAFTDPEAARIVKVHHPEMVEMVEEPVLPFLIKAYRSEANGIVLNPGLPSRLFVVKQHLLDLLKEYAVDKLAQLPGAWVPTQGQNLLLVEYKKGSYTVAIYASEEDAKYVSRKSGGTVIQHPWNVIFGRCRELRAPAPYFHFGLPEQTHLSPQHAEKILQGRHSGYIEERPVVLPFIEIPPSQDKEDHQEVNKSSEKEEPAQTHIVEMKQPATVPPAEERKNPYSIKSQSKPGSEIYRGGNLEIQEEDWPVQQPQAKDTQHEQRIHKPSTVSAQSPKKEKSLPPSLASGSGEVQAGPSAVKQTPVADPAVEEALKKLEKATVEGQGMANGWEVCRAMAELRRIWVVVDPEGNMVILAGQDKSPIVDFFTSARHAQVLIDEAHQKNPSLPKMVPRLVSTKKLYKALAPRQPIVWINRGSPEAWTSIMGDTLPYVLQLMAQGEREKKI